MPNILVFSTLLRLVDSAQKRKTTVKYLKTEFAKGSLDSSNKILGDPRVDCNTIPHRGGITDAQTYLSQE